MSPSRPSFGKANIGSRSLLQISKRIPFLIAVILLISVNQYFAKPVDGWLPMLYDAVHHHCLWSVDGDDFYKRTSRSHRDQVLFGADSFLILPPLGSLNP